MQENYSALKNLPIVLKLKKKNKKLKAENKNLHNLVSFLLKKLSDDNINPETEKCNEKKKYSEIKIKEEPNITYSVEEEKPEWDYKNIKKQVQDGFYKNEITLDSESDESESVFPEILSVINPSSLESSNNKDDIINRIKEEKKIKKEKELIVQVEEVKKRKDALKQESKEVEVEEEEIEEEDGDSPGEEEVENEEEEEEEEEVEEEEEEEVEVEEEEEEEEEEVMEIQIKGKSYYTSDEQNGKIYSIQEDDDVGPEVGHFVNGVAKFNK